MRILLLCHAFNSLTQRLFVELRQDGHQVSVEFDINPEVTAEAVDLHAPEVVLAPFLKRAIPETLWRRVPCLVVHPGPPGDRGPAALDWAILEGQSHWAVTVLQATEQLDGGPVWASAAFSLRAASKSSLYGHEVTEAAVVAVRRALARMVEGEQPQPAPPGILRPAPGATLRTLDWQRDSAATVLRKIRSADGTPGARDHWQGRSLRLFNASLALSGVPELRGTAGAWLARCGDALCRATHDGAVWIGHLRDEAATPSLKLPAARVLPELAASLPDMTPDDPLAATLGPWPIHYAEHADGENVKVGVLAFDFHNGAMDRTRCAHLLTAYRAALARPTRVLVLLGGGDFWSNGLDLNTIEAADSPAEESWRNICALDDLVEQIITTEDRLVVAALAGNAGAGGVFLALAADWVVARDGVVLNPHYKGMGNLYGSEYWTYVLPKRLGEAGARALTEARLPVATAEAREMGLLDQVLAVPRAEFAAAVQQLAQNLALDRQISQRIAAKRARRQADEAHKPLAAYRAEELAHMRRNFFGFDPSYHVARYNFVYKIAKSRTPTAIALHRGALAARPLGEAAGQGEDKR